MAVLVISDHESDLSKLLLRSAQCRFLSFQEAEQEELSEYSAIALLCGTGEGKPKTLSEVLRTKVDEFVESGKAVFYEWCASLGDTFIVGDDYEDGSGSMNDARSRYVYIGEATGQLAYGDLLYSQANAGCIYRYKPQDAKPVLYHGGHIVKHDHVDRSEIDVADISFQDWRLWYYDRSQLVCSFRISNFVRARFAPFQSWCAVIEIILKHLGIEQMKAPEPYYILGSGGDVINTFRKGMKWFEGCDILLNHGRAGVREGLSHTIFPNGTQVKRLNVRVDCVGEVAGAYLFDYLLGGDPSSLEVYYNLSSFVFDRMQIKSGRFRGMLRWTETAWSEVFGDDSGRAMISTLLYMMYTGDKRRLPEIEEALDFLITVTGTDGLMHHGLYTVDLTEDKIRELHSEPSNQYCAHRNAYYSAALLLAYRFDQKESYLDTAMKGLASIMKVYPQTMRAISETEELCRLIFPLACLYQATGMEEHRKWLYDVSERLEHYRHPKGGYIEVDPGYTAYRSRTSGTESSMLADNGNAISELLYSLNWLPLGFAYAYYVTGDKVFLQKWQDIAAFMADVQIVSEDQTIDGAWARCIDLNRMEIYGMPHDVGWGPYCIESGWTVGEILMGLGFGMALQKGIRPFEK